MRIRDVRKVDKGTFTCRASNSHRSKSALVRLRVTAMEEVCGAAVEEEKSKDAGIELTIEERVRRVVGGEPSHISYWPWQVKPKLERIIGT